MHIYNLDCQSYHTNFTSCQINRFPYYYTGCNRYHEVGLKCDRKFKRIIHKSLLFYTIFSSLCSWKCTAISRTLKALLHSEGLCQWNLEQSVWA